MEGFILLLLCFSLLHNMAFSTARDTLNTEQSLSDGETLVSSGESFALGFFAPANSNNRYLGIWYNKGPTMTVVWVANRDHPLKDSSGVLRINETGILVLLNHNNSTVWSSSNSQKLAQNPIAKLLDSGNLIVKDETSNNPKDLWQSFDYPGDTLLPGMKLGRDLTTGLNWYLTSWDTPNDPSEGNYTYQLDMNGYPQFFIKEGKVKKFRFGSWNGLRFSGAPQMKQNSLYTFTFVSNDKEIYYEFELVNVSVLSRMVLSTDGKLQRYSWNGPQNGWTIFATIPGSPCDNYAQCGANAGCKSDNFPSCSCLKGFVPKRPKEWNGGDWSGGCVRRIPLSCHGDGFLKFSGLKLPDTEWSRFNSSMSLMDCGNLCLNNCSCTAYAGLNISEGTSGCLLWFDDLIDIIELGEPQQDIYIRMAQSELGASEGQKLKHTIRKEAAIVISCVLSVGVLILCLAFILYRWKKYSEAREMRGYSERDAGDIGEYQKEDLELPFFDMATLTYATNDFSSRNILGEGGFGSVYKGRLEDGREIAVKRLSRDSRQGIQEFKNEVIHVAKLQHRNLVKLLGCCIQAEERMLVYEFMPNKSLDFLIFDEERRKLLDWPKRIRIIIGIARGLLYLHQDSRHRIVHRDLKAGNILLDAELNPKISDFGLARSFGGEENVANTKHVVGTYGYLSPEYIIDGLFSTKSDVFSFGVLVLEIVSGKRNRGFFHEDHHFNLLGHAWRLFREGRCFEMVDASMLDTFNMSEVLRSIHVGLLCVQRSPEERPSMLSVVTMLSSESSLPQPKMPGFFTERDLVGDSSSSSCYKSCSTNGLTISQINPR